MFRTELPDNQGMLFSIDPLRNVIFVLEKCVYSFGYGFFEEWGSSGNFF
ncbi:MAG: hypothetical protein J7F05_16455 [Trichodesmium erythraeum GBRTRLIN201]|nr:hypothetical protein [Trichodesmium erythraeum GBRTRLIN201]